MDETEILRRMKAIILAAGEDIRMRPLTYTRPKAMLPVGNKPIMEHLLGEVKAAGITEFLFVVGYHGEIIRSYFEDGRKWGVTIEYITQRQQFGTASAVLRAEGRIAKRFLVMNGDIVARAESIRQLMCAEGITLLLTEVNNPSGLGTVEVDGEKIKSIREKILNTSSRIVSAGLYLLTDDVFQAIKNCPASPRGEYDITDALQCLIDSGNRVGYFTTDYWFNPDYPWDLLKANESFLSMLSSRKPREIESNVTIKGKVFIGKESKIKAGSYIEGPVVIGDQCIVGPCCYIRAGTTIGNNCHIGGMVQIENSVIMNNTKISNHAYIGDSIIGERCFIGAGTITANIRFDGRGIKVAGLDTGMQKLGAILGDNVSTGVNVSIDVGTVIGNNSIIGPGAKPRKVILPNSRIF
jgi:UDP-N-acetylglucosamine diphosphorylase/glucosamine-1-phosphate N-acetyltransferase